MKSKKNYIIFMTVLVVIAVGLVIWNYFNSGEVTLSVDEAFAAGEMALSEETEVKSIVVQVSGEVHLPGVYELAPSSRVYEAVNMAGGVTTSAAVEVVNQAEILEDGMHIHFPTISTSEDMSKININTADVNVLKTITGIGEAKALAIMNYREENGPFKAIEDIMKVDGIKEGLFNSMKEEITIY